MEGLTATTHHGALDELRAISPGIKVDDTKRFIDNSRVVVAAGISAGIDMSLQIVALIHGKEIARATARHMEYPFPETNQRRVEAKYLANAG